MSSHQPEPFTEPGADLEYDLAHEADVATPERPDAVERAGAVSTATPDYDGDYSYDLAHDVPGR